MFDLFNVPALDDAAKAGKKVRFTHHPKEYKNCALTKEWAYLKNNYNFENLEEEGDFWYAK